MTRINKNSILLFFLSFLVSQNYSLMEIFWEPQDPNIGDEITIYADVSNNKEFKNSFYMNIHLSTNGEDYITYPMSRDYNMGNSSWTFNYHINDNIFFQIDNNYTFNESAVQEINLFTDNSIFLEVNKFLDNKNYSKAILKLNNIIDSNENDDLISSKSYYIIAEIYLNDFNDYNMASNYYKYIINHYKPSLNIYKKSLFTLGYIYTNYLHMYTEALDVYNKFKLLYPDDDLIMSIDYEIENVLTEQEKIINSLINSSK